MVWMDVCHVRSTHFDTFPQYCIYTYMCRVHALIAQLFEIKSREYFKCINLLDVSPEICLMSSSEITAINFMGAVQRLSCRLLLPTIPSLFLAFKSLSLALCSPLFLCLFIIHIVLFTHIHINMYQLSIHLT